MCSVLCTLYDVLQLCSTTMLSITLHCTVLLRNVGSKLKEMLIENKANQSREPRVSDRVIG